MKKYIVSKSCEASQDIDFQVGDIVTWDDNYLGVKPRLHTGKVRSIGRGFGVKNSPRGSRIFKVEDDITGEIVTVDEAAIQHDDFVLSATGCKASQDTDELDSACKASTEITSTSKEYDVTDTDWFRFLDKIEKETGMKVDPGSRFDRNKEFIELEDKYGRRFDCEVGQVSIYTFDKSDLYEI